MEKKYVVKPQTYEESMKKNKEANERAMFLYEYFKDKNPEFAERVRKNISLMPPDSIVVYDTKEKDLVKKFEN